MRYYQPRLGVFVGRDPIDSDLNRYRYCGNQVPGVVDPLGLQGEEFRFRRWEHAHLREVLGYDPLATPRPAPPPPQAAIDQKNLNDPCGDTCGPDVTAWFFQDVRSQIQYMKRIIAKQNPNNSGMLSDLKAFFYQAKYYMSYKWMDFDAPGCGTGRCRSTVSLANVCIRKNQLGNIMYGILASMFPPNGYTTQSAIQKGYNIGPNYASPYHANTYGTFLGKPRADNLAAFGVGVSFAEAMNANITTSGDYFKTVLGDPKALSRFSSLYPGQVTSLSLANLTFIPQFGGFDTRSCKPCHCKNVKGLSGRTSIGYFLGKLNSDFIDYANKGDN
jgi:uncharacterized protein RhaS with RHS repeats